MNDRKTIAIALLLGVVILGGMGYVWGTNKVPVIVSSQDPTPTLPAIATPTPTMRAWHKQLESESEAISWAMDRYLPENMNVDAFAGRLVSVATLETFLGMTDETRSDGTPVWVVGIITDDPLLQTIIPFPGMPPTQSALNSAVGAYYVFTANDGFLMASGLLHDDTLPGPPGPKYSSLLALSNEPIDIVTPSPGPTYGVPPDHTPDT